MSINKLTDKSSKIIIAIDGESASGKGTLSKKLADMFDLYYCQTSLFYRKLAKLSLENKIDKLDDLLKIAKDLKTLETVSNDGIYNDNVTNRSSEIALIPEIRNALNIPQKAVLQNYDRVVMEGRDIGTVIAPNADVKLYITATINERAKRRYEQYINSGMKADLLDIKKQLEVRDRRDKTREYAPLAIPNDAIVMDSSNYNIDEFFQEVINKISEHLENK